jgi:hypothetical protein
LKPSSAKQKGRLFQQQIAKDLAEAIGLEHGKDKAVESRGMGQTGTDIRLDAEALSRAKFSIECKCTERLDLWGAIRQAKANQIEGTDWLVVVRKNRHEPVVIMNWERFLAHTFRQGE